ncbi:MAG: AsnC family transcriptional regulator [Flammeovirgaceae bacterium]|jgi:Lrp/AsnC family transcriptional regulator for asnA, asnC and gidA|nr:MAG: AsnC family transcriptional regulator [Flammeovirgaceae bacterium]|tara:strand:+ start:1736 stop:2197 length:462 start_codon:yes stop_codon:yes gene_type:complete
MSSNYQIDNIDLKILNVLSKNAKMPYTEVAKKVFVSGGTVHVRMRKLEKMGVVRGTKLDIDYDKLGYNISSYMGIYLEKSFLYKETVKSLKKIPEIVEIHAITGQYTIFIKIICKDTSHFRNFLDTVHKVKGITRTETFMSFEETILDGLALN